MYLNKKKMNMLLHDMFVITWCESRNWAGKRLTDSEMNGTEERIKTFVLNTFDNEKNMKQLKAEQK